MADRKWMSPVSMILREFLSKSISKDRTVEFERVNLIGSKVKLFWESDYYIM